MKFSHLALPVPDAQRAWAFYRDVLEVKGEEREVEDGALSKTARARIVAEIDREPEGFLYAVHLLESRSDFWDIEFPMLRKADEAIARLLMECSFCQRREVVYLNELELKSFEIRKAVAAEYQWPKEP